LDVQRGDTGVEASLDAPDESWIVHDASDGDAQDTESTFDSGLDTETPDAAPSDSAEGDAPAGDVATTDVGASDSTAGDGPACADDLSNIGTGDFHISFTVSSRQGGTAPIANQRAKCGYGMFWDVRLLNGNLHVETDDSVDGGGNYCDLVTTGATVNDGNPHAVVIQRVAGTVTVFVDGTTVGSHASMSSLLQLPPMVTGTDPCNLTTPFAGTLSNLCMSNK
jgi:hypothetical protein